jgi:hypothetical protein
MPTKRVGTRTKRTPGATNKDYDEVLSGVVELLEQARHAAARAVNAIMTATYWEIGRRIVEYDQGGEERAEYGQELMVRLGDDLTKRFGRGFGWRNLFQMRAFYLAWPNILQTASAKSDLGTKILDLQTTPGPLDLTEITRHFPLSWSHYVKLLAVRDEKGREFYEAEALRGGWTVRQLDRQIGSQFLSTHAFIAQQSRHAH